MDPRAIDLNLLVLFDAVYTAGNVGRAARRLGLTSPAASNGLTRLRRQLGDPLFLRTADGVLPTARAHQLIGPVRAALSTLAGGAEEGGSIDLASYRREFRMVMIDAVEAVVMPAVIRLIADRAPGIALELIGGPGGDFVVDLRAGTVDLGVYPFPYEAPDIVTVPLGPSDVVVIARRGHPGIGRRLDVRTLGALPHVGLSRELRTQFILPGDLAAPGVERRIVCSVGKIWSIPWMVEQTGLIAFVPRRFAETVARNYAIEIHESPVPIAGQHIYLMWHERHNADPGHRWLRDRLLEAAEAWQKPPPPKPKRPA